MSIKTFLSYHLKNKRQFSGDTLESRIRYVFKNPALKTQALTHISLARDRGDDAHNERLEFLGDAVLDLCVSDLLMKEYPLVDEGELSKMRSSLVNTNDLASLALSLKLDQELLLSLSAAQDKNQLQPRLLASVLEALVGAVYLDGGYKQSKKLVKYLLGSIIKTGPISKDYKTLLHEFIQKKFQKNPVYSTLKTKGPRHNTVFVIEVKLNKKILGKGTGPNKKQATQSAAFSALKNLGIPFDC